MTPLDSAVTEVDVISLLGGIARVTWRRRSTSEATLGVFPVARRDKADVFVSGAWATGANAKPLYSLDIFVAAPVRDFEMQSLQWRFSLNSSLKTVASTNLDPDAFTVASRLATIFPASLADTGRYLDIQWDTARFEFSRKDEATNFVTAPAGVLSTAPLRRLREDRTVAAALNLDVSLGLELGANLENQIVPDGYGAIVRFVPGVAIYAVFPGTIGLDEIRWTTTYRGRILATNEPLIDLREDQPRLSVEKGVRHEWNDELMFRINPFVGLTIRHEYGSIPPAFRLLNHRETVGATFMWAWKQ